MKKLLYFTVIIALILSSSPVNSSVFFNDVPSDHYGFEAINHIKNMGIISGYTDGSFAPDKYITRAEMASITCRMTKEDQFEIHNIPFADVSKEYWAAGYIAKAYEKNIISGDENGNFKPEANIKYEEAIKMTIMATGMGKSITPYYSDWSKAYIDIADTLKISENIKACKGEYVTRADVAVMIYNALKLKNANLMVYANTLYNSGLQIPLNVSFALDETIFWGNNTQYSKELAKASCVLSMTAYENICTDDLQKGHTDKILNDIGFKRIEKINLQDSFQDNHITSFYMGEKIIETDGAKNRVIAVVIRGTNKSAKEWTSNFDIGSGDEEESYDKENHKGYDITAKRVISEIISYVSKKPITDAADVIWLMGHSRGGSVANICAATLGDSGTKCFAYTFGASQTTVQTNFSDYEYIFNAVNSDDLVTYIPFNEWGFNTYGKTAKISVYQNLLPIWSEMTGLKKYNCKTSLSESIAKIASCSASRKGCYMYPEGEKIQIGLSSQEECEEYKISLLETFAQASRSYCKFETVKAPENSKYEYILEIYMQPAFLMQNIAAVMSGKLGVLSFLTIPLPQYLVQTHSSVIAAYMGGLTHPHTPETYYVIANSLTQDDFK